MDEKKKLLLQKNSHFGELSELRGRIKALSLSEQRQFLEKRKNELPNEYTSHFALGEYLYHQGEYQAALASLEDALALDSDQLEAQQLSHQIRCILDPEYRLKSDATELDLKRRTCPKPFEQFEISAKGYVYLCCPSFLPVAIGNIYEESNLSQMWNSPIAQEIRASITDQSFKYCSRKNCTNINARSLPLLQPEQPLAAQALPKVLTLSYDRSCNLACPSCRTNFIFQDKPEMGTEGKTLFEGTVEKILPILKVAEELSLSGSGDPIASRHFSQLLSLINRQDYPSLRIFFQTNGVLFTEKWWQQNPNLHDIPLTVYVSIDAATENTYKSVRRGGDFSRLKENLAFMGRLREEGKIQKLGLKFVVQDENFVEMENFVKFCLNYHADRIVFMRLRNWGTYEKEDYLRRDVASSLHPRHREFLETLKKPIFRDERVHLGELAEYLPRFSRSGAPVVRLVENLGLGSSGKKLFAKFPSPVQKLALKILY